MFFIASDIKRLLDELVEKRPLEFMLFGKSVPVEGGYRLIDLIVPKQSNQSAHTEIEDDALVALTEEVLERGDDPKDWNVWIHSHNTLGAFFSGEDTRQMDSFGRWGVPFMFSMVLSSQKKEKRELCWYNQFSPFRMNVEVEVKHEKIPAKVTGEAIAQIEALELRKMEIEDEIKALSGGGLFDQYNTLIDEKTVKVKKWGGWNNKQGQFDRDWGWSYNNIYNIPNKQLELASYFENPTVSDSALIDYLFRDFTPKFKGKKRKEFIELGKIFWGTTISQILVFKLVEEFERNDRFYFEFMRRISKMNPENEMIEKFLSYNPFKDVSTVYA